MAKNTQEVQEREEAARYTSWLIRELEAQVHIRAGEALKITDQAWLEYQAMVNGLAG